MVLDKNKAWHVKKKLEINFLKKGAKLLEGTHDFSTFRSSSCYAKSAIKKLNSVKVLKKVKNLYYIQIPIFPTKPSEIYGWLS